MRRIVAARSKTPQIDAPLNEKSPSDAMVARAVFGDIAEGDLKTWGLSDRQHATIRRRSPPGMKRQTSPITSFLSFEKPDFSASMPLEAEDSGQKRVPHAAHA
jgi:hypothetical protein